MFVALVIVLLLAWLLRYLADIGVNSGTASTKVKTVTTKTDKTPTLNDKADYLLDILRQNKDLQWVGEEFKKTLNGMSLSQFNKWKMRGINTAKKAPNEASRGYMKLEDIVKTTGLKIRGKVLSLACGPGGWEQYITPLVHKILAITLGSGPGHVGHANFTTTYWNGKEKIKTMYADITKPETYRLAGNLDDYQWILFDGGEEHTSYEEEASKHYKLLKHGVMPYLRPKHDFVIKILNPTYKPTIQLLKEIQKLTGKGTLVLSSYSRASNIEMYFVSTRPEPVETKIRIHLLDKFTRAREGRLKINIRECEVTWQNTPYHLPKLDLTESVKELGYALKETPLSFAHWKSIATYPMGNDGSKATPRNAFVWRMLTGITHIIPGLMEWTGTNNTPSGFLKMFRDKIDKSPTEISEHHEKLKETYQKLAARIVAKGFKPEVYDDRELRNIMNTQGAPNVGDIWKTVGEFFDDPEKNRIIAEAEADLLQGKTKYGIFRGIGKREKKKSGESKGSRMVAFLHIPMRYIEAKYMACLQKLTKPDVNPMGVGSIGLHDLGERLKEIWKGYGVADDVAAFDTCVSATVLAMEFKEFISNLGYTKKQLEVIEAVYRIYSHPHVLIPRPHEFLRSELVQGLGQRMSGTIVTYGMNTITSLCLMLVRLSCATGLDVDTLLDQVYKGEIGVAQSGDDGVLSASYEMLSKYAEAHDVWNSLGFPRKNTGPSAPSKIQDEFEDVEFCSHRYAPITYYDSYTQETVERMMPVRNISEIFAKASISLRFQPGDITAEAWASAQANNLLVNYHGMRDCRRLGLAIKSSVNKHLVLTDKGAHYLPKPWLDTGDIMDIINRCLFGESTRYPKPGFRVRELKHLGYVHQREENLLNMAHRDPSMKRWRENLFRDVNYYAARSDDIDNYYTQYYYFD